MQSSIALLSIYGTFMVNYYQFLVNPPSINTEWMIRNFWPIWIMFSYVFFCNIIKVKQFCTVLLYCYIYIFCTFLPFYLHLCYLLNRYMFLLEPKKLFQDTLNHVITSSKLIIFVSFYYIVAFNHFFFT